MKIIPAIDIIDGKCVRLSQGDYSRKVIYNEQPLEVAKSFEDAGIKYLHLVDLDGAKERKIINHKVLEQLASDTNLIIDFGGGLTVIDDVRIAFESGANQVTGGSVAAKNMEEFLSWLSKYGKEKIILGADCKDGRIAISGWLEQTDLDVLQFISAYENHGVTTTVCTDIAKDGMLLGPSLELYKQILDSSTVNLIASGGISSIEDVIACKEINCAGVIIGKAIYEGKVSLKQLSELC